MRHGDLFIKKAPQTRKVGLYRYTPYGMYEATRVSDIETAIEKHNKLYVSVDPLPEIYEQYYVVGGKRFELDNRKGAEWYAGKFAARKGQKPRFELVTVYNRTYDRQDF